MNIILFGATWCTPCKQLWAILDEEMPEGIDSVEYLDIEINGPYAIENGIRSVPTIILKDEFGGELNRYNGGMSKAQLKRWIEQNS